MPSRCAFPTSRSSPRTSWRSNGWGRGNRQAAGLAPDGAVSDVEINGRHLSFIASRLTYRGEEVILATFSDISDHKRVQAALAQAKRAADDANAGKTVFLATMSHEIRTPLYGTLGTVELLGLTPLTNLQRGYLRTIRPRPPACST